MVVCQIAQRGICADIITRKQLIAKLQHQLGDRLVQFDIVGSSLL